MKHIIIAGFLAIFLFASCSKKHADVVGYVTKEKEKINKSLSNYTFKEVDDIISHNSGAVSGYYDGDRPRKISTQNFSDKNRVFKDYYFADGMLIFVEEQLFVYNLPNTYTEEIARERGDSVWYDDAKTQLEVNRYYFDENVLVKWIGEDGREVAATSPEFVQAQPQVISQALYALGQLDRE